MKEKIIGFFIVLFVGAILFCVGVGSRSLGSPNEVYQVYLNGQKIGLIESEQKLLDLIDQEQVSIKETFKVDKVYPPTGFNIEKVLTYSNDITDTVDIYNKIKDSEPFTINGYVVTIYYQKNTDEESDEEDKPPLKLYVFDPEIVNKALREVANTFIGKNELLAYEEGTQTEITETGSIITSAYFDETITIKEAYVSIEDKIFDSEVELTQYLLYGTTEEQKKYTVKVGEDLKKIANDNKLNIAELLIANPKYPSGDALLAPGDVLNVGLINPLINVTYRKTEVSDISAAYETEYVDDSSKYVEYLEIKQKGKEGVTRITKDVKYTNGEMINVNITKQELVKAPVNKVIVRGTKKHNTYQGTAPSPITAGDFMWPTNIPYVITTHFEYRWGSFHKGIDISGTGWGSPIYSSTDGVVISTYNGCAPKGSLGNKCGGGQGNNIKVSTSLGYDIIYMHLMPTILVQPGQKVTKGQVIGYMGASGGSTGYHLHFEVDVAGTRNAVNPCKLLPRC